MPKGVYDRETSAWRPKPRKQYPPELVADVRRLYEAGMTMREVASAVGASVKVLQTLMPRHHIERRPAIKRDQAGPANASWKGDDAGYAALHLRARQFHGEEGATCSTCGVTDGLEMSNRSGDYADMADYWWLCRPCHRSYDARRRRETGSNTIPDELRWPR